ncbi:MAG: M20/M25/M40 family metallo-hydrolase [Patescibacteria group bacterium]
MKKNKLIDLCLSYESLAVELRRKFHAQPELRWCETRTLEIISDYIRPLNIPAESCTVSEWRGGIVIDVYFDPDFNRLLFRADIDALPVHEETGLNFASQNTGVSHACGHDFHIAGLLTFLQLLADGKLAPKHNLRLVFQRAEENPGGDPIPESGGHSLVNSGVLGNIIAEIFFYNFFKSLTISRIIIYFHQALPADTDDIF